MRRLVTSRLAIITVFSFLILFSTTDYTHAQYKKNKKSSITGNKFKVKKRKSSNGPSSNRRLPKNYIRSIKLYGLLGTATYFGELCDGGECARARHNITLGAKYRLSSHLAVRSSLSFYRLAGSDDGDDVARLRRQLSFRSDNIEFKVDAVYDILPYLKLYRRRHAFMPYVFAGLALTTNSPKAEFEGSFVNLRPLETEGVSYSGVAFAIPFGGGIRYKFSPHINIGYQAGYRFTFTDYLDDVSTVYDPTKALLAVGNPERELSDRREVQQFEGRRGNADNDDGYFITGFTLDYTLVVPKQNYNLRRNRSRLRVVKSVKRR